MRVSFRPKRIRRALLVFTTVSMLWISSLSADEGNSLSYPEFGITTSSLMHPSVGYWWGQIGVRFTGMYLNENHHEFHFNIGYAFYDSAKVQQSVNLLTSWIAASDPGADYRYAATGLAYSINYNGLFFEIGLARPWRDEIGNLAHDHVVPCGYWGYIYRFKP